MSTQRLFLAVKPAPGILKDLVNFQQALKRSEALAPHLSLTRWVPETHLHLTLHFLGEVEMARIDPLIEDLTGLLAAPGFGDPAQVLGETFAFPVPRQARVAGLGGKAGAPLVKLHQETKVILQKQGFTVEARDLAAHVTMLRFSKPAQFLPTDLDSMNPEKPLAFPIEEVVLYRSQLGFQGSTYTALWEFPLLP